MALHDFIKTQFIYAKPYSIYNLNDYIKIIYLDHSDGTVFQAAQSRLYRFTKDDPASLNIYNWLAKELYNYINNQITETIESFDKWHHNICTEFVNKSNTLGFHNSSAEPVRYGLAQKFVNIALKYIYCFKDSNSVDKYNKFDFCHVALDSYTYCPATTSRKSKYYHGYYKSITRINGPKLYTPFYTENIYLAAQIKYLKPWSKLNYSSVGNTIGYYEIETEMRNYFNSHPIIYKNIIHLDTKGLACCASSARLTPFQIEFFLW